jgi:hypothetical protein
MKMPVYQDSSNRGKLSNRLDYLEPFAEGHGFKGGSLVDLINFFDVENSLRYTKRWIEPTDKRAGRWATYCDEYAGAVLREASGQCLIPHSIWWANTEIENRVAKGEDVPIILYPKQGETQTVREFGARSVHAWLKKWAESFGWQLINEKMRSTADTALREAVTAQQTLGIISTPTHIALVLPDGLMQPTKKQAGVIAFSTTPLQSQAGSINAKAWYYDKWYSNQKSVVRAYIPRNVLVNIKG